MDWYNHCLCLLLVINQHTLSCCRATTACKYKSCLYFLIHTLSDSKTHWLTSIAHEIRIPFYTRPLRECWVFTNTMQHFVGIQMDGKVLGCFFSISAALKNFAQTLNVTASFTCLQSYKKKWKCNNFVLCIHKNETPTMARHQQSGLDTCRWLAWEINLNINNLTATVIVLGSKWCCKTDWLVIMFKIP